MAAGEWVWLWGGVGLDGGKADEDKERTYVRAHPLIPHPLHTHRRPSTPTKKKILCKPSKCLWHASYQNDKTKPLHTQSARPGNHASPSPTREKERKKQKEKGSRPFHKATTPDSLATVQILRVNSASLRDIHARAKNKQITKCTIDRFEGQENARSLQAIARQLTHTLTGIAFSV